MSSDDIFNKLGSQKMCFGSDEDVFFFLCFFFVESF